MYNTEHNIALEWVISLLTCAITFISYGMTKELLKTSSEGTLIVLDFYRGAFVFLVPCAIEGINLITSKISKKKAIDVCELFIGAAGILLTGYLLYEVIVEGNLLCAKLISYLLLIYPLKFVISSVDGFIELIKLRRG